MKKIIEVDVKNIGDSKGSIGWLLKQDIKMVIGHTKSGYLGYWLHIGTESELGGLYNGEYPGTGADIVPADGCNPVEIERHLYYGADPQKAFSVVFTDAAWEKVIEIDKLCYLRFEQVMEDMEEGQSKEAESVAISLA